VLFVFCWAAFEEDINGEKNLSLVPPLSRQIYTGRSSVFVAEERSQEAGARMFVYKSETPL